MQGQSPAAQTGTSPTQITNKEWTCQRWFNNIATKVSTKTHRYVGKFVAVVTLPIIFIPSLARDLFCGTKNLYQRVINKAPVANQVSSKGTTATSAATHSDNVVVLPPVVLPDSVRAYSCHTPPTIEQLRKDFPELNQVICAMETSADETEQQLAEYEVMNEQLKNELAQTRLTLSNYMMKCNSLEKHAMEFKLQLGESLAKNYRHEDTINVLNRDIEDLKAEINQLLTANGNLTRRVGTFLLGRTQFPKLDCAFEEPGEKDELQVLSCPDEPHNSDQAEIIVLEDETTSTSEGEAERIITALNDAIAEPECEDLDESVLPITTPDAEESSLTVEASDSEDSFETIADAGIPIITVTDYDQLSKVKADVE